MGERIKITAKKPLSTKENSASNKQKTGFQSQNSHVDQILFLQRTIGNQAVQRLIKSGALQAKLRIGQPGDVYEQEADRVADEVMRMPEPQVVTRQDGGPSIEPACFDSEAEKLRRQPEEEEEELISPKPLVERITPVVQRQVEEEEEEEELLQTKEMAGNDAEITPGLESRIIAIKSGGQPMPESERAFFEPRFGYDFSKVRVHTDAKAAESARAVNGLAYTVGQDVVFGAGQYATGISEGRRLLAHELTHVVQQSKGMQYRAVLMSSDPFMVQRVCGRQGITHELEKMSDQCIGLSGELPGEVYRFRVACDEFEPAEEDRLKKYAAKIDPEDVVEVHGFASEEGPADFNDNLSCVRAWKAAEVISGIGVYGSQIRLFNHGATTGPKKDRRSVVISVVKPTDPSPEFKAPKKKKEEKVIVWMNAFIPKNVPGVTKPVSVGSFKGQTMLEAPWPHECFMTDNRGFSSTKNAKARMRQGLVINVDTLQVTAPVKYSDPTTQIDCDDGHVLCRSMEDPSMTYKLLERTATKLIVEISGAGSNPCVKGSPNIDYDGKLLLDKSHGMLSLAFKGRVDEFPAFEMYALSTKEGSPKVVFQSMPPAGNTPWDLIGPPPLQRKGFVVF